VNLGVEMELWTGVACLIADPNCKDFSRFGDDGKGAYVNIVAWASSEEEFRQRVEKIAPKLDCILLELEHIQLLNERMEQPDYPQDLIDMRSTAERQPADIVFGTFHIWEQSDIT
jgi:hypothetical protein